MSDGGVGRRGLAFGFYVWRRFDSDGGFGTAAALSYTTLLSAVPLAVVAFGMLSAFPAFHNAEGAVQGLIFRLFLPSIGERVVGQFGRFLANARGMTAIGIAGFAVTALMLIHTVERGFNAIWRVRRPSPLLLRALAWWAAITLGPLLFGAALSLTSAAPNWALRLPGAAFLTRLVLPPVLEILAFFLAYLSLPNHPVRRSDALAGAVVAGLLFEALKVAFVLYITYLPGFEKVYGALALVPLFLFWMYLAWAVVLAGAEVAASLPEWRAGAEAPGMAAPGRMGRLGLALLVLRLLAAGARQGRPVSSKTLIRRIGRRPDAIMEAVEELHRTGFVAEDAEGGLRPGRDLGHATLGDLARALGLGLHAAELAILPAPLADRLAKRLAPVEAAERDALDLPLIQVLAGGMGPGGTRPVYGMGRNR